VQTSRILVVDDLPLNRQVLQRQLQQCGYVADVACNGLEALEYLSLAPYTVALMDCQMPILDGYEATRQLRLREGEQHRTIVIAVTSNATTDNRDRCLAAGMDDFLAKPVSVSLLQATLKYWTTER
jgi:CheY-like chemotaxis protein